MGNAVEKGPDIKVQNPVLAPAALSGHGQRVMGRTPGTVTITVTVEDRLQLLLQQHRRCGLRHPVGRVGHAEDPDPRSMVLRYLHRPHRPRHVASRGHPIPQLIEVVPHIVVEPGDADGVHARRPVVGPDLLPRLKDEAFGDLKRLHFRLRSHRRLLPLRVDLRLTVVCPAPWLQPHYRAFIATTSRPAPLPRIGTLPLTVLAAWGPPFRW